MEHATVVKFAEMSRLTPDRCGVYESSKSRAFPLSHRGGALDGSPRQSRILGSLRREKDRVFPKGRSNERDGGGDGIQQCRSPQIHHNARGAG
jgi:hypothetical protein